MASTISGTDSINLVCFENCIHFCILAASALGTNVKKQQIIMKKQKQICGAYNENNNEKSVDKDTIKKQ